jgi:hypothetical protein
MLAMAIYSRVKQLQSRLETERHSGWANRLAGAIHGASTSGEALTSLAVVLDELRNEHGVVPDVRTEAVQLLEEVDQLLHPPGWVWNADLSRYEPPGSIAPLEFRYALTGQGWAEAYISDGRNWLRPTASYLSDALRALIDAVGAIVRGGARVACIWEEEPGNFIWVLEGDGNSVTIEIYWTSRGVDARWEARGAKSEEGINVAFEPPSGRVPGELRGQFATTRRDLGTSVLRAIDRLIEDGDQGYANRWGAPFPHREHESLRKALGPLP